VLLSALVHPGHADAEHRLEAIAARLGVAVVGRHTALGDALLTAEAFLKLIPLLAERGIRTLGQAREASRRTAYAKLDYRGALCVTDSPAAPRCRSQAPWQAIGWPW
jgi:DNA polymerase-3 subunit epsilon